MMLKKMKRTIAMVTSSRADYRYVYRVMKHLKEDRYVNLQVIVTGMHLSSEFGNTYQELIKDGFSIDQKVEMLVSSNTSAGSLPIRLTSKLIRPRCAIPMTVSTIPDEPAR